MSLLKRVAKDVERLTLRVTVLENRAKSAKKPVKRTAKKVTADIPTFKKGDIVSTKKTAVKKTARKKVARKVS